jgi:hypothetical protein
MALSKKELWCGVRWLVQITRSLHICLVFISGFPSFLHILRHVSDHCMVDTIGLVPTEWSGHPLLREAVGIDVCMYCMLLSTVEGSDVKARAAGK